MEDASEVNTKIEDGERMRYFMTDAHHLTLDLARHYLGRHPESLIAIGAHLLLWQGR